MNRTWSLLLFAVTMVPGVAAAQRPHRSGLWGELGWGPGAVRIGCSNCTEVRFAPGSTGHWRIGGTLSNKVLLGFEQFGLLNQKFVFAPGDSAVVAENSTFQAVILWFPWRGGVFLKGGVGWADGRFTVTQNGQDVNTSGVGVGMSFGVGFDKPISRKFAITANAAAYITAIGDVTVNGATTDDVIATVYQLSLGFTFR